MNIRYTRDLWVFTPILYHMVVKLGHLRKFDELRGDFRHALWYSGDRDAAKRCISMSIVAFAAKAGPFLTISGRERENAAYT